MNKVKEAAILAAPGNQAAIAARIAVDVGRQNDLLNQKAQAEANHKATVQQIQANAAPLLAELAALRQQQADTAAKIEQLHQEAEVNAPRAVEESRRQYVQTAAVLNASLAEVADTLAQLRAG